MKYQNNLIRDIAINGYGVKNSFTEMDFYLSKTTTI